MAPVIDTCVYHRWSSLSDFRPYLPAAWQSYVGVPGSLPGGAGARQFFPLFGYPNPAGDHLPEAEPEDGTPTGSNWAVLERRLAETGPERVLLLHGAPSMFVPAALNPYLAAAVVSALNNWSRDTWLSRDDRLYGAVLIPTQTPTDAAAEIRRVGVDPRFAGVLIATIATGKLLGHPIHDPIFEAAAELELPLILHRGGDAVPEIPAGTAGGPPFTFAEYSTLAPLAVISQVVSLISNGVFEKYPGLRVYLVGTGVTWIPGVLRRLQLAWYSLRREVPWVKESPSDYFHQHFRVSTFGLERDAGVDIVRGIADLHPELADVVCHGSGYPAWDTVSTDAVRDAFPAGWHDRVLFENATKSFRWAAVPNEPASAGARER